MPLFGNFRSKSPPTRVIIDFGAHAISSVVFEVPAAGGLPTIVKKLSFKIPYSYTPLRAVAKLREEIFKVLKILGRMPERITVGIGGHCVESSSLEDWTVRGVGGEGGLAPAALPRFFATLKEQNRDASRTEFVHPVALAINGYFIDPESFGRTQAVAAETVTFRTMRAACPREIGEALREAERMLGGVPVEFVPFPMLWREALRFMKSDDALLIDIGGTKTLLVTFVGGELAHAAWFGEGVHRVLDATVRRLGISLAEAEDRLRQLAGGVAGPGDRARFQMIAGGVADEWKREFRATLDNFYAAGPLPEKVYVCGEGAYFPDITSYLRTGEWLKDFSYVDSVRVQTLEGRSFFEGSSLGGFVRGPEEAGLAALMIYSLYHKPLFQ